MRVSNKAATFVGAVVMVAAIGLGFELVWGDDKGDQPATSSTTVPAGADLAGLVEASGFGDPARIEVPPVVGDSTVVWLEGEGAVSVDLVTTTERLWAEGHSACREVAEALDDLGTPEAIAGAAGETPDGPTRQILLGLHTATGSALSACGDPEAFVIARAELGWQWALTDRRLNEIGVAR